MVSSGIWSMRYWTALFFFDNGTKFSIEAVEDFRDNNPFSIDGRRGLVCAHPVFYFLSTLNEY